MTISDSEKNTNETLPSMIREYQVESLLGCGRTGKVYKAKDPRSGRPVAIRCFFDGYAPEEKSMCHADIPNLVRSYASGVDAEGHAFLVMEYVDGGTVNDLLRKSGAIDSKKTTEIGIACCHALEAIEKCACFYYDATPDRIRITPDGKYKLSLSGFIPDPDLSEYMAPEQFNSMENCDSRSTIYSLGITMYQLVSGKLPFEASGKDELKKMHEYAEPKVPGCFQPELSIDLEYIIMRCIQKDKKDRYQHWRELRNDLQAFLYGKPLPSVTDAASSGKGASNGKHRSVFVVKNEKRRLLLIRCIAGGVCAVLTCLFIFLFSLLNPSQDFTDFYPDEGDSEKMPAPSESAAPNEKMQNAGERERQKKIWLKVRQDAKDALASGNNCSSAATGLLMYANDQDEAVRKEALSLLDELDTRTGIRDFLIKEILPLLAQGKYREAYKAYVSEDRKKAYRESQLEQILQEMSLVPDLYETKYHDPYAGLNKLSVTEQYGKLQDIPELSQYCISLWCLNAAIRQNDKVRYQKFRKELPVRLISAYDRYIDVERQGL